MITTQLNGGLGNQMFQYALGRSLANKHNSELYLDTQIFNNLHSSDTKREFELDVFNVPVKIASLSIKLSFLLKKYLTFPFNQHSKIYIKEKNFNFDKSILELPDNIYLSGYWQSEKYFKDIRSTILEDFAKRISPISSKNAKLKSDISKSESISLHVRRTDYVTNPNANAYHGICDIAYYKKAMEYIEKIVKYPEYFVFSDDPDWAEANIKSKYKMVFISHNSGRDSHEDIRLMADCKHNIIANSSFSWWGAWLNQNQGKIVIAPKKWFNTSSINMNDLIPKVWVQL